MKLFYHGMLLGILSIVSSKYRILSNRESGLGHFDIELIPLSKDIPAFIFEIKNTKDVKKIDDLSTKALNQIEEKKYDIDLKANGIENVIKIGIAFCGKEICLKSNNNL